MLKKNLLKITSTALAFAVLISFALFGAGAAKSPPENPIGEAAEALEPDVIFGSKGSNELPNQSEAAGESEDSPNPEQSTDPDDKTEQTPEGIPEIEKEEPSQTENPNTDKPADDQGGDTAGEGSGDMGNSEAPEGDPTVVTDLDNMIITSDELLGDMFSFFAYIENGREGYSLTVNFKNSSTSFSGENLSASEDYYETKLSLGANYFTIYLEENGKIVSSAQYIVTYQAAKASGSNADVGDGISITTNLDGFDGTLENKYFTFTVSARTYGGKVVYSDHIEVTLDGVIVDDPTGSSVFEYVLNFGPEETHLVTVLAWDDDGNSSYREYEVKFKNTAEGDSIGFATVIIDATTAGLGIIGEAECEILQGETAANTLLNAADMMGLSIHYSGSPDSGSSFYVSGISGFAGVPNPPEELWELILRDGLSLTGNPSGSVLKDGNFTANSGWMYSINGTLYPGKGLSAYNLSDGDTIYLRYSLAAGKDIGGSCGGIGVLDSYCGIWSDGGYYELDHDYIELDRAEPTPTEDGFVEYECSLCKKVFTETLPATGEEEHTHEYEETYRQEPTETEDGFIEYTCSCGDFYQEILPATGTGKEDEETEEGGGTP